VNGGLMEGRSTGRGSPPTETNTSMDMLSHGYSMSIHNATSPNSISRPSTTIGRSGLSLAMEDRKTLIDTSMLFNDDLVPSSPSIVQMVVVIHAPDVIVGVAPPPKHTSNSPVPQHSIPRIVVQENQQFTDAYPEIPFLDTLHMFVFPSSSKRIPKSVREFTPPPPTVHHFVLTMPDARRLYGTAYTITQKDGTRHAICLLSYHRLFISFSNFLTAYVDNHCPFGTLSSSNFGDFQNYRSYIFLIR
jgi:hypothetical protein